MTTAAEQRGAEKVCKTRPTGSIPAVASKFIPVMRRDNIEEMLSLLDGYYREIGKPGWSTKKLIILSPRKVIIATHDMIRLANSIVAKYGELQKRYIELSKENSKLKRTNKSEDGK